MFGIGTYFIKETPTELSPGKFLILCVMVGSCTPEALGVRPEGHPEGLGGQKLKVKIWYSSLSKVVGDLHRSPFGFIQLFGGPNPEALGPPKILGKTLKAL